MCVGPCRWGEGGGGGCLLPWWVGGATWRIGEPCPEGEPEIGTEPVPVSTVLLLDLDVNSIAVWFLVCVVVDVVAVWVPKLSTTSATSPELTREHVLPALRIPLPKLPPAALHSSGSATWCALLWRMIGDELPSVGLMWLPFEFMLSPRWRGEEDCAN